jgi:ankyrin repeat protein
MGDDPEIVRFLLDHGADPNLPGQPVLHVAASRGNIQIVKLLLDAGANPNALDEHSTAPLDRATFGGQEEIVRLLLTKGAKVDEDHWPNDRSLLDEVCAKGPARMISLLVEFGADPIHLDRFGETPLDLALASKNEDAVGVLMKLARQRKPLELAAENAMENAAVRGYTDVARILLEKGLDVNGLTQQGSTYLGDAAFKQQVNMVRFLLANGADVGLHSRSGGTALHDAALGGSAVVIDLLLDNGANIDVRQLDTGATPLMLAASLNQREAVAALLRRGANPQLRDHSDRTALDHARETASPEVIDLLSKSRL